jgi:hypothetical protein
MSLSLGVKVGIVCAICLLCSCCSSSSVLVVDRSCDSKGTLAQIKGFDNALGLITCLPCFLPIKLLAFLVCALTGR